MSAMDTQTTQPPRLSLFGGGRPGGLKLQVEQTTTHAPDIQMDGEGGEGGMLQLNGGDGVDLNASYEVSEAGTLRAGGFVIKSQGIQAAPERRYSAAASASSAAASSSAAAPSSPDSMPSGVPNFNPSDFLELGSVGKGACGLVKRAIHVPSLRVVALKSISIFDKEKRHQFVKELSALGSVASPYIVGFAGAWYSEGSVTILLQYANRHSLLEVLKAHGAFDEFLLQRIALHTFKGIEIMHQNHVIHRDLKPGNILIDSSARCCLTDFGVVVALEGTMDLASTFVGTTIFMAPERVTSEGKYSYASDIWSLGISLWYMATGELPYSTTSGYWGIVSAIRENPVPVLPAVSPKSGVPFSHNFRSFLDRCLQKDPKQRATATELLKHPFLANADATWTAALAKVAATPNHPPLHPLMAMTEGDLSDLDALLSALYNSVYAKLLPGGRAGPGADYRKSLMDLARLQRLAESLGNTAMPMAFVQARFEKLYADKRAAGQ